MQRTKSLPGVMGAAARLAVDGDQLAGAGAIGVDGVADPVLEALLEGLRLQCDQQAADAVTRGDSVGQRKELAQPVVAVSCPAVDGGGAIAAADHAADSDHYDIDEPVLAVARVPGVREGLKVRADGFDVHPFGSHARGPGVPSAASTGNPRSPHRREPLAPMMYQTAIDRASPPILPIYARWPWRKTGSADLILGVREENLQQILPGSPCGPGAYPFSPGRFNDPCAMFHYWSPHPGGANFAFADGSVRLIRYSANPIMQALASRAGGEVATLTD